MAYLDVDKTTSQEMALGEPKTTAKRYPLCTPHRPLQFGLVTPVLEKPLTLLSGTDWRTRSANDWARPLSRIGGSQMRLGPGICQCARRLRALNQWTTYALVLAPTAGIHRTHNCCIGGPARDACPNNGLSLLESYFPRRAQSLRQEEIPRQPSKNAKNNNALQ
jgi:hypothetical protein